MHEGAFLFFPCTTRMSKYIMHYKNWKVTSVVDIKIELLSAVSQANQIYNLNQRIDFINSVTQQFSSNSNRHFHVIFLQETNRKPYSPLH